MAKKGMSLKAGTTAPNRMPGREKRVGDRSPSSRSDLGSVFSRGNRVANAMRSGMRSGSLRVPQVDDAIIPG